MSKTINAKCESIQQNTNQYTARFIVTIPGAQPVENKIPVKSVVTVQFAGKENAGFEIDKDYQISIQAVNE